VFRVLNALDLVHFIMGHHKLVQPKMGGGSWGQGEGTGGSCPPPGAAHGGDIASFFFDCVDCYLMNTGDVLIV